jgi:hypothetical protein
MMKCSTACGKALLVATALLAAGCASVPPPPDTITLRYVSRFSESPPEANPPPGWRPWTFSRFKKSTEYVVVEEDGQRVVRAAADGSASGLVHPLKLDPGLYPLLTWRWRVDELIPNADNTMKHAEDSPARIVVSFAGDIDSLPLDERFFYDNFRLVTGQQLPYATLMYIWENRAPHGTVIRNPHTSRIKMIVAESGAEKLGAWHEVTRNVVEDFRRAFGEEPGTITAVAIMTDSDNTGMKAHAWYGDVLFRREIPPRTVFASD